MNVKLIAHTQVSESFAADIPAAEYMTNVTDGQVVALTAIRTCYSHHKPTGIVREEGEKYFGQPATDGEGGTDADRLFRHIVSSGHTSTLEHITFTFAIEGISRACLAQLTRHRVGFSYSVQSQRFVRFGSDDKSGGFDYVVPPSILDETKRGTFFDPVEEEEYELTALDAFETYMLEIQSMYDMLRNLGVPAEDARMVLPNAATCNLVMTANLRALLDFYSKRQKGRGAQWEIAELAELLREEVTKVEPWTEKFFEEA